MDLVLSLTKRQRLAKYIVVLFQTVMLLLVVACYNPESHTPDAWNLTERQLDSLSFSTTHHYSQNYNFLVKADSLQLLFQQPSEALSGLLIDTLRVVRGDRLVVADIVTMTQDSIDSVWVKVARDQQTMGWTRESVLLKAVSPADPISQFIDFFSDTHMLIFLAVLVVVMAAFLIRRLMRLQAKLVHFNDINSFYPSLLCLQVAASAVIYSSIQLLAPESWRHYYYHPTLNPFALPWHLGLFLISVWAILIVAIATFFDVRRQLRPHEALFYFIGLMGMCALCYVVFSVSTLYWVGYPLLLAYAAFALHVYKRRSRTLYSCGNCGEPMREKGRCPKCGAINE